MFVSVQANQIQLDSALNLAEDLWRPLGSMLIGNLLGHIRRTKISMDGGRVLMRDLDEYYNVRHTHTYTYTYTYSNAYFHSYTWLNCLHTCLPA